MQEKFTFTVETGGTCGSSCVSKGWKGTLYSLGLLLIKIPALREPDLLFLSLVWRNTELLIFSVSLMIIGWVFLETIQVGHLLAEGSVFGMHML